MPVKYAKIKIQFISFLSVYQVCSFFACPHVAVSITIVPIGPIASYRCPTDLEKRMDVSARVILINTYSFNNNEREVVW